MSDWKQYALSVILCALGCGIITNLTGDSRRKNILRLICGTVLGISILHPLTEIKISRFPGMENDNQDAAASYIAIGESTAREAREQYIKEAFEAYISSKAETLGASLTVEVLLDENMVPAFAELSGTGDASAQAQLAAILETDLQITKENQLWIWNQENNSS